jgi:class 3 adenylate cyclase
VIVAEVAADEVFAPVTDLTRAIVLATLAIVFVVCLASMALAQAFSRPVRRLAAGVRHVAEGHLGTQVDGRFSGEFSDLANAFNDMSRSLQVKQDLLDEQLAENDRLLLAIMPETVAERYRQGEDLIAEDHQDVSVLFAEVVGFDELSRGTGNSTEGLAMLSDLVRSFDDAAARLGIEKIRTTHTGYLASCGLTVPRIDHARRIVDFALEMQRTVERFTRTHGAALRLRAGIDTGTVSSGLLSRTNLVYDLWGDAVTLAHRVSDAGGARGIFLTDEAARRLPKTYLLEPTGELGTATGSQQIWSVRGGES